MYERKCEWGMMGRQPGEPRTAVQSNAGLTPSKGEKGGGKKVVWKPLRPHRVLQDP